MKLKQLKTALMEIEIGLFFYILYMMPSRIVAGTVTRSDYGSGFLFHKEKGGLAERWGGE
ncbi:hypothetical protein [Paenibacillus xylanexedens]|uniref:hypothetical protein n=1 Tax=Paenibacillus xylanexedens TaxID=528191 RepID=UPI001C8E8699|nr:hypothetical protein [Paenibacillus xylanexedens]